MILGAMVDLGVDIKEIRKALKKIDLKGYNLHSKKNLFEKLQNKSDDWIIEYTNCYKEEVQNLRNSYSWIGCIGGNMILLLIISTWPDEENNETDKK